MTAEIFKKSLSWELEMPVFLRGMGLVRLVADFLVALSGFHLVCTAPVERDWFYTFTFSSARNLVQDGLDCASMEATGGIFLRGYGKT